MLVREVNIADTMSFIIQEHNNSQNNIYTNFQRHLEPVLLGCTTTHLTMIFH